jgi:hypothetical protein
MLLCSADRDDRLRNIESTYVLARFSSVVTIVILIGQLSRYRQTQFSSDTAEFTTVRCLLDDTLWDIGRWT